MQRVCPSPRNPNTTSSLGAPDAHCTGIALFSNTIRPSIYHQLPASLHHLHPAPRPGPPARTHTFRLLSALGPPALHPPQMKGSSSASALGRQRAAATASCATAAAPAAPRRGAAAVWARSTRLLVLRVLRSALPPPIRHLTENGRRRPAPYVPRPSQGLPGGSRANPSMLHVRHGPPRFSGGGARGGAAALRHICRRVGLRNRWRTGGVPRPRLPSSRPRAWGAELRAAASGSSPSHLGPSEWRAPTCYSFAAALELFHSFLFPFLISTYVWSRSFYCIRLLGKISQGKPLKLLWCIRFATAAHLKLKGEGESNCLQWSSRT